MIRKHPHQTGFTLVEMAIVLAILGIILGGLFAGTSALRETSKFKEDQQKLQDIKAALLSYVAVNHYLPCPDTSGDGIENPHDFSQAQCNATSGNLPHLSLGTHAVNAYGLPFSYYINTSANDANSVTDPGTSASYFGRMNCNPNTTNQTSAPCFNKDTPPTSASSGMGNFDISNGSSNIAIEIPLVVISHGQNGCNGVTGREADNCTSNAATYYQAPQNREGPNAFDDVLIWLSSLEIKHASPTVLAFYSGNQNENGAVNPGDSPLDKPIDLDTFEANIISDDGSDIDPEESSSEGDSIKITEDLEPNAEGTSFDLGQGHDKLYILQDVNREITGGQHTKEIYVGGDVNANITLNGNDEHIIEIGARAYLSDGTWGIYGGSLNADITFTSNSDNQVTIWGSITVDGKILTEQKNTTTDIYIGQDLIGLISINGGVVYFGKPSITNAERGKIFGETSILCRSSSGFVTCPVI